MLSFFKQSFLLLAFSIFFIQPLHSQSYNPIEFTKNVAYGTNGTILIASAGKISYERMVISPNNFLHLSVWYRADLGGVYIRDLYAYYGVGVTFLTNGKKDNHIELNCGLGYFDKAITRPFRSMNDLGFPTVGLGYRYQKPSGGLVFRTGLGAPDLLYISFGYAF